MLSRAAASSTLSEDSGCSDSEDEDERLLASRLLAGGAGVGVGRGLRGGSSFLAGARIGADVVEGRGRRGHGRRSSFDRNALRFIVIGFQDPDLPAWTDVAASKATMTTTTMTAVATIGLNLNILGCLV